MRGSKLAGRSKLVRMNQGRSASPAPKVTHLSPANYPVARKQSGLVSLGLKTQQVIPLGESSSAHDGNQAPAAVETAPKVGSDCPYGNLATDHGRAKSERPVRLPGCVASAQPIPPAMHFATQATPQTAAFSDAAP